MSVWAGWQADLLAAASLPDTASNRRFLTDWHAHAETDCKLNPIDLHLKEPRLTGDAKGETSSDCKALDVPYHSWHAQSYTDKVWARTAFAGQIGSANFKHLAAAIKSGDPYKADPYDPVVRDIGNWGSHTFANYYGNEQFQGGPPPTLKAPQALRGWSDMQRAVNRHMPAALHESQTNRARALRQLERARKVLR